MIKSETCSNCELVCSLRDLADKAEALAPVADAEGELLQVQQDSAMSRAERFELENIASRAIYEELGVRVDEVDPQEYLQAAIDACDAVEANAKAMGALGLTDGRGQRQADYLRQEADMLEQNCDGPTKGLKVPFLDIVMPLPFGREHCGSAVRAGGKSALELADISLVPAIRYMEPETANPTVEK